MESKEIIDKTTIFYVSQNNHLIPSKVGFEPVQLSHKIPTIGLNTFSYLLKCYFKKKLTCTLAVISISPSAIGACSFESMSAAL